MRKRLLLSLGLLACLLAGFVAGLWLTGPRHRITEQSFEEIRKGMVQQEVEEILGCPPGDYGQDNALAPLKDQIEATGLRVWRAGKILIFVAYDEGKVSHKSITHLPGAPDPFLDRLRRWLRLPWW